MPRCPNTRPTTIYWLVDVRPETLVKWPNGYPFYCGKTVMTPADRFTTHKCDIRRYPHKAISKRLSECGESVRIQTMEIVPHTVNWIDREKYWIYVLRLLWPGAVNLTAGGQGHSGYIASTESRIKRSLAMKGRVFSEEHRANIGKASANRSPDVYRRIGESQKGRSTSTETRRKLSIAGKGRRLSDETRERMKIAANRRSPGTFAKISAKLKGRKFSPETLERMSAGQRRRQQALRAKRDAHH